MDQTEATRDRPCDAVIMAIVDSWDVGGEVRYHKGDMARIEVGADALARFLDESFRQRVVDELTAAGLPVFSAIAYGNPAKARPQSAP